MFRCRVPPATNFRFLAADDNDLRVRQKFLERAHERDMAMRLLLKSLPRATQGAFRRVQVARLAQQKSKALQGDCSDAIPGWNCFVDKRFQALYQIFVIVGRKPKAAVVRVFKMPQ